MQTLGRIGGDAVIDPLRHALTDANPSVRQAAIQALTRMNDPEATAVLKDAHLVE